MKKKFFIVRSGSRFHPPRFEYFDSEKKFLAGLPAKRSIDLSQCFSVNKRTDSKHKFGIIVYTKDDSFTVLAENADERDDWFNEVLEAFREGICDMDFVKHYGKLESFPCFAVAYLIECPLSSVGLGPVLFGETLP